VKKCQVIFGDVDDEKLQKKEMAKQKMKELKEEMSNDLKELVDKDDINVDTSIKTLRNEY